MPDRRWFCPSRIPDNTQRLVFVQFQAQAVDRDELMQLRFEEPAALQHVRNTHRLTLEDGFAIDWHRVGLSCRL